MNSLEIVLQTAVSFTRAGRSYCDATCPEVKHPLVGFDFGVTIRCRVQAQSQLIDRQIKNIRATLIDSHEVKLNGCTSSKGEVTSS